MCIPAFHKPEEGLALYNFSVCCNGLVSLQGSSFYCLSTPNDGVKSGQKSYVQSFYSCIPSVVWTCLSAFKYVVHFDCLVGREIRINLFSAWSRKILIGRNQFYFLRNRNFSMLIIPVSLHICHVTKNRLSLCYFYAFFSGSGTNDEHWMQTLSPLTAWIYIFYIRILWDQNWQTEG